MAKKIHRMMDISNLPCLWLRQPRYGATACRSQIMSRGKWKASYGEVVRKAGALNALAIMTFIAMLGDWAWRGLRVN